MDFFMMVMSVDGATRELPGLSPRSKFGLMRPCITRLAVYLPIGLGNVVGIKNASLILHRISIREVATDELGIDGTINDGMSHMNAPRP